MRLCARILFTAAIVLASATAHAQVSSVTVTANRTSPQQVGTTTTWTATPTGGTAPHWYWWSISRNGSWIGGSNDFTLNNQWVWTPAQTGTYRFCVGVWSNDGDPYADAEAEACSTDFVIVSSMTVTGVTVSANRTSPQIVGTAITFTAAPTAGTGLAPYSYKWSISGDNGATWSVLQDWTSNASQYVWTPQQVNSSWRIAAAVRSSGSTNANGEASNYITFATTGTPWVSAVSLAANRTSPQPTATTITWTATPTYGTPPLWYYWTIYRNGSWLAEYGWNASNQFVWTPQQTGTYRFCVGVWSDNGDFNGDPEASTCSADFIITAATTVTAVTLTPNLASPRCAGELIWWTASPSWGTAPISYKWSLSSDGGGTWSVLQDWTANASLFAWRPLQLGSSWRISVAARSAGSTSSTGEASAVASFVTTACPTVTYVSVTASPSSEHVVGNQVTLTANATGGTPPLWYYWMVSRDGSFVTSSGDWSTSNQFVYTPQVTGSYAFSVSVISNEGDWTSEGEATGGINLTVIPVPPPHPDTPNVTGPPNQTNVVGTTITPVAITATDPRNLPLTYSASGLPAGLAVNQTTGIISGTITATAGSYTVTVYASNGQYTGNRSLKWTVIQNPPSPPAYARVFDTFTTSGSATNISNHLPETNWLNWGWTVVDGQPPVVDGGVAVGVGQSSSPYAIATIESGTSDGLVSVDFTSTATRRRAGLVLRIANPTNFLLLQYTGNWSSGRVELLERVNGTFRILKGVSVGPLDGTHQLKARIVNGSVTGYLDNLALFETTANNNSWGTQHGLLWDRSFDTTTAYDNFTVSTEIVPRPLPWNATCEASLDRWVVPVDRGNNTVTIQVTMPHPECWWTARGLTANLAGGPYPIQGSSYAQFFIGNRPDNDTTPLVSYGIAAGKLVMFVQAGTDVGECQYGTSIDRVQFNADGGSATVTVMPSYPSCSWLVTPDYRNESAGWIDILPGGLPRYGQGTFTITVGKNPNALVGRSAYLNIGTRSEWPVEQLAEQCGLELSRSFIRTSADNQSFDVWVTTPPECGWEALVDPEAAGWIGITENPTGSGYLNFRVSLANNPPGNPARQGKVYVRHGGVIRGTVSILQCPVGAGDTCELDPGGTISYVHTDAIGSVRMITDGGQNVVAQYDYLPFGQNWETTPPAANQSSLRFTGAERDDGLVFGGQVPMDYFGARYYQSQTGRFTRPDDPIFGDPFDPQSMNLYAYARNNPLRWVDPTGHGPCPPDSEAMFCAETDPPDIGWLLFVLHGLGGILSDAVDTITGTAVVGAPEDAHTWAPKEPTVNPYVMAAAGIVVAKRLPARSGTQIVERAMSRAELAATRSSGLLRGGRSGTHYVSDAVNSNARRAQQRLALPQRPEVRVTLEVPAGRFSAPAPVTSRFGMPGGGLERTATGEVPARILRVQPY